MDKGTFEKYLNILSLIEFSKPETDEFAALTDELRSLPGHPKGVHPEDFVRVELTSVQH
jgi:hypothetical protein